MKCIVRGTRFLVLVQLLNQVLITFASLETGDSEDNQEQEAGDQQGSWSHWWSYEGISGPDYWNINKRWRICTSGRKQSPIDVRTERLVFDHLLGPIRLSWLDEEEMEQHSEGQQQREEQVVANAGAASGGLKEALQRGTVVAELLNSGRGIELWMEPTNGSRASGGARLILSHGPLSYAYQLFKVELHAGLALGSAPEAIAGTATRNVASAVSDSTGEEEEQVPEALRSFKTSEHLIDGRPFDAELQLHFYNRQLAKSANQAQQLAHLDSRANLFAAISVFIEKRPEVMAPQTESPLDFMLDRLESIRDQGKALRLRLSRSHIEALVPELSQYVTYQGSQNRPPCAESVDWILLNRALRVNESKLRLLFNQQTTNTNQENIRPINALNRRLLRTTINNLNGNAAAAAAAAAASAQQPPAGADCVMGSLQLGNYQQPMYFGVTDGAKMVETSDLPPLRNSPDSLYQEFMETQENYVQSQQQIQKDECGPFLLSNQFEELMIAHLNVLKKLREKRSLTETDSNICNKLEVLLKEERNTWRLIKKLIKDGLLPAPEQENISYNSDRMDDSGDVQNGTHEEHMVPAHPAFSEDYIINKYFMKNNEFRRMQLVTDWLEENEAEDLESEENDDRVEFYQDGQTAWENTFHVMQSKYNTHIPDLDITVNPNAGVELCSAMDPDAPIRTKKSLDHMDKEVEIRLFKHLFRFLRAGKLDESQELAQRVNYHWLAAILVGWWLYSDKNIDGEIEGKQVYEIESPVGNKKRDIWKQTAFRAAKIHGLNSCEKAILGVLGGNLKSVLPVCNSWSDQLWARLKCSIDVELVKALRNPDISPQAKNLTEYPREFYENYQDIYNIFKSIKELNIVSPFKEATIHQTIQRFFILNDIDGLLVQLEAWCKSLDYDNNLADNNEAISPQFLRFFAHIVLFLREVDMINEDDPRGTAIIEHYINLLTHHRSIEAVAYYTAFLPRDNQVVSYAKLLATISDREERKHCLKKAKDYKLDIDEITQTVFEIIMKEPNTSGPLNESMSESTKTTAFDKRKINALEYLLYLDSKNYVAILHHGNSLLRYFALDKKMDAVKETFLKLPSDLKECVENQWRVHTNSDITTSLRNNLRELDAFRVVLEAQEELFQWSEWHHKKPEEPKRPANLSKFCDNVNYEQRLRQYQQDMTLWNELREVRTDALGVKIFELFYFPDGWMQDLATEESQNETRTHQLGRLRRIFIPQMTSVYYNVLHLTGRYEDCLKISNLLAREDLKLHEEFTKVQLRDFLDKISEVTKIIVRKSVAES